ncbi:hypothetical protein E2C01_024080 [Portunus trituberculatus]|uniref:Uncharacterized protein n=1 Tax=Portunus trituberculatus TaxID=210409 RepID=A0A5B7E9M5_PORTR|nr:hypothetical protein [Portunus trituberculatus]
MTPIRDTNNTLTTNLKAPPYHASRQALEYTSASRGQNVHHSLLYPSPLLVQNKNRVQHQLVISHSTCHQNALQPASNVA